MSRTATRLSLVACALILAACSNPTAPEPAVQAQQQVKSPTTTPRADVAACDWIIPWC